MGIFKSLKKVKRRRALVLTGFDIQKNKGGIETFNIYLNDVLKKMGFEVNFLYAENFQNSMGIYSDWLGKVYYMGQYVEGLSLGKDDIVILNGYYGGGYINKKVKTYTFFHSVHPFYAEAIRDISSLSVYWELKHVVGDIFERNALKNAHRIMAVSEGVRRQLSGYYGIDSRRIIKLDNPVDTNIFYPLSMDELVAIRDRYSFKSDKIGLFVGRWEEAKGTNILEEVIKATPDILWIVVCNYGGREVSGDENIKVLKNLNKKELNEIYSISNFLFFPSLYEGFGLVMAEALSSGCPVVANRVGFLLDDGEYSIFLMEKNFFYDLGEKSNNDSKKKMLHLKRIKDIIDLSFKKKYTLSEKKSIHKFIKKNFSIEEWEKKIERILCC